MNYKNIYHLFIEDRKTKQHGLDSFHEHHIIPKSCGGNNESSNLIKLSYSDHLFAHSLLARIYGGSMWMALFMMLNCKTKYTNKSYRHSYSASKHEHSTIMSNPKSEQHKDNISKALRGLQKSDSHRAKLSTANKGKTMDDDTKNKISMKLKGRKFSKSHRAKISEANKRRTHTEESKQKIRDCKKGIKLSDDVRLKMSESSPNKRKVFIYDINNNVTIFLSVAEAALELGAKKENIAMWCRMGHTPKSGKLANRKFSYEY